jgi:hypothetical protein
MPNRLIASLFALALAVVCSGLTQPQRADKGERSIGALTAQAPVPTPPPPATPMPKPTDVATPVY